MEEKHYSILERYGDNFTQHKYITNPAIGREKQIKELVLVLLTPEKSGILIGKPGIGKTAIVEGLSYRIQQNDVPDALRGYEIISVKTASLLGTLPTGESKVQLLIDELKFKDKIILFVDEIHMLIGSTEESSVDFANIFKEGLGRGQIKVIGATTTAEYERYILRDKAFTRRFQKIDVPEPTHEETVKILMGTYPKIEAETKVRMKYTNYRKEMIMDFIVGITSEYKRVFEIGSRYPDVSLTLLKSAFSFAVFDNRKEMDIYDVEKALINTKLVYPDVVKKEMPIFKEKFKDLYEAEEQEKMGIRTILTSTVLPDANIEAPYKNQTIQNSQMDLMKNQVPNNQNHFINQSIGQNVLSVSNYSSDLPKIKEGLRDEDLLNNKILSERDDYSFDIKSLNEENYIPDKLKNELNLDEFDMDKDSYADDFFE